MIWRDVGHMRRFVPAITKRRLLLAVLLGYFVVPSTVTLVHVRWQVASLLRHACNVRLEEYQGFRPPRVLASVELTSKEADTVLAALPYAPDIGTPGMQKGCSFSPHHRIVLVAQDGTATNIEVCFVCAALSIRQDANRHSPVIEMPFAWRLTLPRLFTNHGIPRRDHYKDYETPEPAP